MPNINFDNASGGLGRLAWRWAAGVPKAAYQKAYDNELGLQSKLAQAMASIEASGASARLHTLQGDEAQGQLDARKPEAMLGNVLTTNGIPTDEAGAVRRLPGDRPARGPLSPAGGRQWPRGSRAGLAGQARRGGALAGQHAGRDHAGRTRTSRTSPRPTRSARTKSARAR
jgi:hypothetical protein